MRKRHTFLLAAVVTTALVSEARGDIYHLKSPSTLETEKGSKLSLPPGYFLDEDTWTERDLEMRRLQEQEVRLKAENASLRGSSDDFPWVTTGIIGAVGVALGIFVVAMK